jgi:hypothetical protein
MRAHPIAALAIVVASVAGGAAACNSLIGIQGGTARPAVKQLAAGGAFACALLEDGTVWCWGADDHQQLGHLDLDADVPCKWAGPDASENVGLCNPTPTAVTGLTGVTQIAVGSDFACALLGTGDVKCWGGDDFEQVGPRDAGDVAYKNCPSTLIEGGTVGWASLCTPVPKAIRIPKATTIAAGTTHACAATLHGVYCWGNNDQNILDNPTMGHGPVLAMDVPHALELAAPLSDPPIMFDDSTCALTSTKSTICWGNGLPGGPGGCTNGLCMFSTPRSQSVHVGAGFGCTLGATGTFECWGQNSAYVFDSQNAGGTNATPMASDYSQVLELQDKATVTLLDARYAHVLVVDQEGRLWSWGDNSSGELGAAPSSSPASCYGGPCSNVPFEVSLEDGGAVSAIATGVAFSLALTSDGTVWAWGANTEAQLGYQGDGKPCVKLEAGLAEPCNWLPTALQVPP